MQTIKDVHALLHAADTDASLFVPRAALATLVRTQGSSFRRGGSRMLIGGNGAVVRGFSGGCPESDLVVRARRVIETGQAERAVYDREHGLDLLIEMGCGGELDIVLEPLAQRSSLHFLDVIAQLWSARTPAMLASVFPRDLQSAIGRLIWRGGEILLDTLPVPGNAATIIAAAGDADESAYRQLAVAGVDADVLYEPILPPIQLVLIGANAVADALVDTAQQMAWPIVRIDPKTATPAAVFAGAHAPAPCDANTFIVCMTYQLERDLDFAAAALATAAPYVGILGSLRRAEQVRRRLDERCGSAALQRLYTPAGLSIGSEDAEQIAISLVAEIMAVAARKSGLPLSRASEPIHAQGKTPTS